MTRPPVNTHPFLTTDRPDAAPAGIPGERGAGALGGAVVPRLATPQSEHPLIAVVELDDPLVTRTIGLVER